MKMQIAMKIDLEREAAALDLLQQLDAAAATKLEELKKTDLHAYRRRLAELLAAIAADRRDAVNQRRPARQKALTRLLKSRGLKTAAAVTRP